MPMAADAPVVLRGCLGAPGNSSCRFSCVEDTSTQGEKQVVRCGCQSPRVRGGHVCTSEQAGGSAKARNDRCDLLELIYL